MAHGVVARRGGGIGAGLAYALVESGLAAKFARGGSSTALSPARSGGKLASGCKG